MADTPLDVVTRYCKGMEIGPEACLAEMADDFVLNAPTVPPPLAQVYAGIEANRAAFTFLHEKLYASFRWAELNIYTTNDPELIFVRAKSDAVLKDGRPHSNDYMWCTRVRNGKMIEHWEFMDGARVTEAAKSIS